MTPRDGVVVIGSANVDVIVAVERRPSAGETVLGGDAARLPGGKGANQAAAAARAGAPCRFLGAVGDDADGARVLAALADAGADTAGVARVDRPTGTALITVTPDGENAIVVAPGANAAVTTAMVDRWRPVWSTAAVMVVNLELPLAVVGHAVAAAGGAGVRVLVNAAPALPLPAEMVAVADPLVVNEHEAATVLGRSGSPADLATALRAGGARSVVITLGAAGAWLDGDHGSGPIPALRVDPVDTTGAGDAFVGALAAELAVGVTLGEAARFATVMAAHSVTGRGAQASYGSRAELERWRVDGAGSSAG